MDPSKPRKSSSRRSSILKPPKPRQPLQNVNFNSSSNESSPSTAKLKRRVSFAEKKHVKEFCNSVEQGTVWDNTYEEHDLSSLKQPCPSSQAQYGTEEASKENIEVDRLQNELNRISPTNTTEDLARCNNEEDAGQVFTSNEVPQENPNVSDCDLNFTNPVETIQSRCVPESQEDKFRFPRQSNTNFDLHASKAVISVYTDEDENINHIQETNMDNVEPTDLEETCIQDAPMEFTGVIGSSLCPTKVYGDEKGVGKENDCMMNAKLPTMPLSVFQDTSMDITQAVPTAISLLRSNLEQLHHAQQVVECNTISDDRTQYFHNASVEYTMGLESLKTRVSSQLQNDPVHNVQVCTENLDTSMEFTMAVPTALKPVINAVYANTNKHHTEDERTKVFQDAPMEFTTAVSVISSDVQGSNSNGLKSKPNERTMLFSDVSMEMTGAVRTVNTCSNETHNALTATVRAPQDRNEIIATDDRTRLLNVSMEMTKAIGINISPIQSGKNVNAMDSGNVHILQTDIGKESSHINTNKEGVDVNNTTVYNDEPMEFTTVIPAFPKGSTHSLRNNSAETHDKTTIFQNQSITMTAAVPSFHTRNNNPVTETVTFNSNLNQDKASNKTVLYPNVSMEVTGAISSLIHRPRLLCEPTNLDPEDAALLKNIGKENIPYSTRIFETELTIATNNIGASNEATMEITAAVSNPLMKSRAVSSKENSTPERSLRGFKNDNSPKEVALKDPENFENKMLLHEPVDRPKRHSDQMESVAENACLSSTTTTNAPTSVAVSTNAISGLDTSVDSGLHHSKRIRIHEDSETPIATKAPSEQIITQTPVQKSAFNFSITRENLLATNKGGVKDLAAENDVTFCFKARDKDSRAHSTLRHPDTSHDANNINEEDSMEMSVTFFNGSLEELEAIKPPSFMCVDDSTPDNTSANSVTDQEVKDQNDHGTSQPAAITSRVSIISKVTEDNAPIDVQDSQYDYRDYNLVRDHRMSGLTVDLTRKSQSFVIRNKKVDVDVNTSKLEVEDQIRLSEVQKLHLTYMDNTNVVDQGLDCSSSLLGETSKGICIYRVKDGHTTNAEEQVDYSRCAEENNAENKELECSLPTTSNYCEEIPLPDVEIADMDETEVAIISERLEKDCSTDKIQSCDAQNESHNSIGTEKSENNEDTLNTESIHSEESYVDHKEKDDSFELDVFSSLLKKLKIRARSDDIIWDVYHENIERNMIVIGFISCSLLAVLFITDDCDNDPDNLIRELKIISRLADDADTLMHIVHQIILEKIDTRKLTFLYKSYEDILPMLEHISTEVKLSLDFMFDLKRLDDLNLMDIKRNRISFVSRTRRMDIILKVTIHVKPFNKIQPCDVIVDCLLGSVRVDDVKQLITNVKRDHKFLRRYMNDVRDYIYLMEETSFAVKDNF